MASALFGGGGGVGNLPTVTRCPQRPKSHCVLPDRPNRKDQANNGRPFVLNADNPDRPAPARGRDGCGNVQTHTLSAGSDDQGPTLISVVLPCRRGSILPHSLERARLTVRSSFPAGSPGFPSTPKLLHGLFSVLDETQPQ